MVNPNIQPLEGTNGRARLPRALSIFLSLICFFCVFDAVRQGWLSDLSGPMYLTMGMYGIVLAVTVRGFFFFFLYKALSPDGDLSLKMLRVLAIVWVTLDVSFFSMFVPVAIETWDYTFWDWVASAGGLLLFSAIPFWICTYAEVKVAPLSNATLDESAA